ncbi:MAG: glycosyltransferase family 4 protein [Victivallaceae bacterium]|nr:glycosyltransferase family 4 protein [Victivallaceae bacterium]
MKIAILHYHLNPGGVTRIIAMQLEALLARPEITALQLFSGAAPDDSLNLPPEVEFICNPELNYLDGLELGAREIDLSYNRLIEFLLETADADTIIHAHNLGLGKNPVLTAAMNALVTTGRRLVNHIHDFAEDRPDNLSVLTRLIEGHFGRPLCDLLYPRRENCHYAVINSPDLKRLTELGLPPDRISLLPNPVAVETLRGSAEIRAARAKVRRLLNTDPALPNYVYPVRGIRRKNLGEFILLAALFRDKANWIITLPPLNPAEKTAYDQWKQFCAAEHIPVIFEAGEICAFKEIMAAADRSVTTSVREGFGMAFLEAWLFGLPIVGRDLPVTADFTGAGVKLDGLYRQLNWQGTDFAQSGQQRQMELIRKFSASPVSARAFLEENPDLMKLFRQFSPELITANRRLIQQQYSVENYGKRLLALYQAFI